MTKAHTDLGRLIESNDVMDQPQPLRDRAARDGYLFFRSLLEAQAVLDLRRRFATILQQVGWLAPNTDPLDTIAGRPGMTESDPDFRPVFERFQRLQAFHAMAHDPAILAVLEALFGEPVLVHPRNIGRVMFPDTPVTPPHQDHLHIGGTHNTWTAWIPLGDCPIELGALAVVPGLHTRGMLPWRDMPGAGGAGIESEHLGPQTTWLTTDYRAGDVIFVHSLCPHFGQPNRTGRRIRLSVDYRYQPISQPVDAGSLKPHQNWFDWPHVYADWPDERHRYYWKDLPLNIIDSTGAGSY